MFLKSKIRKDKIDFFQNIFYWFHLDDPYFYSMQLVRHLEEYAGFSEWECPRPTMFGRQENEEMGTILRWKSSAWVWKYLHQVV